MGGAPIHPAVARSPGGKEAVTDVFQAIAHSLALLLSTTDSLAGLILSMFTIVAFVVTFIVLCAIAKVEMSFYVILFAFGLGLAFCVSVGWLAPWVAILTVLLPVFVWAMGRGRTGGGEG